MVFIVQFVVIFFIVLLVNVLATFLMQKDSRDKQVTKRDVIVSLIITIFILFYFVLAEELGF